VEFVVKVLPTGSLSTRARTAPRGGTCGWGRGQQNSFQLWSKRSYGTESEEYVVEIAYSQVASKQVTREDESTSTRRIASKVTTYSRTVTFDGGYDYATMTTRKVSLKRPPARANSRRLRCTHSEPVGRG